MLGHGHARKGSRAAAPQLPTCVQQLLSGFVAYRQVLQVAGHVGVQEGHPHVAHHQVSCTKEEGKWVGGWVGGWVWVVGVWGKGGLCMAAVVR
jgi:hypothetical protein